MNRDITIRKCKYKYFWYKFLDKTLPRRMKRMMVISAIVGYISRSSKDFEEIVINVASLLNTATTDPRAALGPAYFRTIIFNDKKFNDVKIHREDGSKVAISQLDASHFADRRILREFTEILLNNIPAWAVYGVKSIMARDIASALDTLYIESTLQILHAT